MKPRLPVQVWGQVLFSALGLGAIASCGGSVSISTEGNPSAGGSAGGSSTTGSMSFVCSGSTPLASGLERCANGLVHRTDPVTCSSQVPRSDWVVVAPDAGVTGYLCARDTDCTARPNGFCYSTPNGGGPYCVYGCITDDDCAAGEVCQCGEPVGTCVSAQCRSDSDCTGSAVCGIYAVHPGCPGTSYACQTAEDECATDADCSACPDGGFCSVPRACSFDGTRRVCAPSTCSFGRPFLVGGAERLAPVSARSDWSTGESILGERHGDRALACAWTDLVLMEHASIAAFARFTLQLLSLGAPSDLVERSNAAQADETRHARLCFAIASGYGERSVGPGPLRIDDSLDQTSLLDVLVNVIHEGCIGETLAALEAAEARAHAVDPAVRRALAIIVEDELRHAELAWRFVRWALSQGGLAARRAAEQAFASARDRDEGGILAADEAADRRLLDGGILPRSLRSRLRVEGMAAVVLPCARRLLAEHSDVAA